MKFLVALIIVAMLFSMTFAMETQGKSGYTSTARSYGKETKKKEEIKRVAKIYAPASCTSYSHTCKKGYSYDGKLKKCTKSEIKTTKPTLECKKGYTYDSSCGRCTKKDVQTCDVKLVCKHGYKLTKKSKKCVKLVKHSTPVQKECAKGYKLYNDKCEKTVKVEKKASLKCNTGYNYDASKKRCVKHTTSVAKPKTTCTTYGCSEATKKQGFVYNSKKNKCLRKKVFKVKSGKTRCAKISKKLVRLLKKVKSTKQHKNTYSAGSTKSKTY